MTRLLATFVVTIAFALAGCVNAAPSTPHALADEAAFPEPTWVPPASPTVAAAMPEHGLVGPPTTREAQVTYRIHAPGETAVALSLDGAPIASAIVSGEASWPIDLAPGHSQLRVTMEAPGLAAEEIVDLVRLVATTVRVEFCRWDDGQDRALQEEVWIDIDSRPAAPFYEAEGAVHPDLFSAHDQLRLFAEITGLSVEASYFPSFQGFLLDKIDACPRAQAEGVPWWTFFVNGEEASQGMSLQPVAAGDVILWQMTPCA